MKIITKVEYTEVKGDTAYILKRCTEDNLVTLPATRDSKDILVHKEELQEQLRGRPLRNPNTGEDIVVAWSEEVGTVFGLSFQTLKEQDEEIALLRNDLQHCDKANQQLRTQAANLSVTVGELRNKLHNLKNASFWDRVRFVLTGKIKMKEWGL